MSGSHAIHEDILKALRAYDKAMRGNCEDRVTWQEVDATRWDVSDAISKVIREATDTRDQEIERLTAELAELRARPTLEQVLMALENATWYHAESYETATCAIRQLYAEDHPMTDPTPPRAPDAVPEAVRERNRALLVAARDYFEGNTERSLHELREKQAAIDAAIATALREATETRDQEIAKLRAIMAKSSAERLSEYMKWCDREKHLTAALEAAQADTARLDWMAMHGHPIEMRGCAETVGMHYGLMAAPEVPLRNAIDAARAAGEREG